MLTLRELILQLVHCYQEQVNLHKKLNDTGQELVETQLQHLYRKQKELLVKANTNYPKQLSDSLQFHHLTDGISSWVIQFDKEFIQDRPVYSCQIFPCQEVVQ